VTPEAALHSAVFIRYVVIVAATLAAGGAALAAMRWVLSRDVGDVAMIYRSWIVLAVLVIGCVFAGRVWTIALVGLLSVLAVKEFARATGLYRDWWLTGTVYAGIVAGCAVCIVDDPRADHAGWYGLYMALPVFVIAALMLIPIVRNRAQGQVQSLFLSIVAFVYLGWMFGHLGMLADSRDAYGYVLYLLFAVEMNDVAAYTTGKLLGRHKLRSNISPNKTWEGSLGALAVSLALPWLLWFSFPHFGALDLILTGLIVGLGGQLGDLSISLIKRDIGVKDMGALIRGHGGVLDRIDSLIYTAPLFLHLVRWRHDLW
jgi:phosphatidate cytidylyltransferase